MTAAVLEARTAPEAPEVVEDTRRFRPDIQGLRAIAVTLVVLYHAGVPGITGGYVGVDVFFVISGFLITGHLVREIDRTGRVRLGSFYARRVRRLLPAAVTVVVVTVLVARFWGPALQLRTTALDAVWTAGYALNVHLAAQGVDYLQADGPASPLQHFWSLAVEEQFYLVWPLLVLVAALVARFAGRWALTAVVGAVVASSLALSISLTGTAAPTAYFSALTRAWEFGIGALLALAVVLLARVPGALRSAATWVGLALVVGSALRFDDATPFPGSAALVPVLGTALVIAGGCGGAARGSTDVALGRRPVQWVGKVSYGWYLWHWPVLILAPAVVGMEFSWFRNVELSILALWFAVLTYLIVERPAQRSTLRTAPWLGRGALLSGAAALAAVGILVTAPAIAGNGAPAAPFGVASSDPRDLAPVLAAAARNPAVPGNLTPALDDAPRDVPVTESGCHLPFLAVQQGACEYGDPQGARTVVLFGDSHAQQWMGALDAEAKRLGWRLVSLTKAACPVADLTIASPVLKRDYTECTTWRDATIARIQDMAPDVVIVSQSDSVPGRLVSNQTWSEQTAATLEKLTQKGTRVEFLADTPYPKGDVPTCVADSLADVRACQVTRADAYHASALYTERHRMVSAAADEVGVGVVDPVSWLCSPTACPVVVGDTLVYRDDSHITNTYSTKLAPLFEPLLTGDGATRQETTG
ncbi:MAG: acyltransferase family protein [Candidatus Nanopelagicales bacterium]